MVTRKRSSTNCCEGRKIRPDEDESNGSEAAAVVFTAGDGAAGGGSPFGTVVEWGRGSAKDVAGRKTLAAEEPVAVFESGLGGWSKTLRSLI